MRRAFFPLLLALVLICAGCAGDPAATDPSAPVLSAAAETQPAVSATVPPDGNPDDVTCKGSYQGNLDNTVVAILGDKTLTNRELQVWYWAEAARYLQEGHETAPDFSKPLDTQPCPLDDTVNSWQQYFLNRALTAWHSAQALLAHSAEVPLSTEAAYQPRQSLHKNLEGMPASRFLYRQDTYTPNTMHQAYLDNLPATLEQLALDLGYESTELMAQSVFGITGQTLLDYAQTYNQAYFYFTNLTYYLEEDAEAQTLFLEENRSSYAQGKAVDIRHILLIPGEEIPEFAETPAAATSTAPTDPSQPTVSADPREHCLRQAQALLSAWESTARTTYTFAEFAQKYSRDQGTALDGGAYHNITQGQLIAPVDSWCFDEARKPGDTAILESELGIHILYFCGSRETSEVQAEEAFTQLQQEAMLAWIRESYPAEFDYSKMILGTGKALVSSMDLLYPDVAHERFPEIPLYLQQDYPATPYGYVWIATHGCGITTLSMVASYMADDELTPPEMCAAFGRYASSEGTDSSLFYKEPSSLGFYLRESTQNDSTALAALEEGQIVVSLQHRGYWTRGGHYIALEELTEDGRVQVRDSNIYNYATLEAHKEDLHTWDSITENSFRYWIFEDKVTYIPACSRCGGQEAAEGCLLTGTYLCHKCTPALTRRDAFQNALIQ